MYINIGLSAATACAFDHTLSAVSQFRISLLLKIPWHLRLILVWHLKRTLSHRELPVVEEGLLVHWRIVHVISVRVLHVRLWHLLVVIGPELPKAPLLVLLRVLVHDNLKQVCRFDLPGHQIVVHLLVNVQEDVLQLQVECFSIIAARLNGHQVGKGTRNLLEDLDVLIHRRGGLLFHIQVVRSLADLANHLADFLSLLVDGIYRLGDVSKHKRQNLVLGHFVVHCLEHFLWVVDCLDLVVECPDLDVDSLDFLIEGLVCDLELLKLLDVVAVELAVRRRLRNALNDLLVGHVEQIQVLFSDGKLVLCFRIHADGNFEFSLVILNELDVVLGVLRGGHSVPFIAVLLSVEIVLVLFSLDFLLQRFDELNALHLGFLEAGHHGLESLGASEFFKVVNFLFQLCGELLVLLLLRVVL